jgi:putative two-component system response regulator
VLSARARRRVERYNARLEREVSARTEQLREAQLEVVMRLAEVAERRDGATGAHIARMSDLCEAVALRLGWNEHDAELLRHASVLHDVGKVAIPDRVLLKPGKLDAAEWELMKTHTTVGAEMLAGSSSPLLQLAERIALTHHERWDGSGYPHGSAGEAIPAEGRIAAICDVYDALRSERPYKPAWSEQQALAVIVGERGRHFDPRVVDAFLTILDAHAASVAPLADAA